MQRVLSPRLPGAAPAAGLKTASGLVAAALTVSCAATPAPMRTLTPLTPEPMEPRAPFDDLSGMLQQYRAQGAMPAIGAAVWRDGHLVALGVAGVRKQGDPTPVALGDAWHLGSDTKAMTATLIGIYVDRGKLHFEDTVGELFHGEALDPGWASVTVEQLLQHRGGAPHDFPPGVLDQMRRDGKMPEARIRAVRAVLSLPPAQPPGTFAYSNAGYMVLGAALERLEGTTWETLLTREVFTPLHMRSCGFGAPGSHDTVDAPWGHESMGQGLVGMPPGPRADNPPALGPAGTVHCSLEDWGTFLSMHVAGGRGESTLVSPATMSRLHTPPPGGDYAAGWVVLTRSWAGGTALNHTGSNTMWSAVAWLAPGKNIAFAAVSNRFGDIALQALDAATAALIHRYAR
jgi:D-alanyl-D-alanine carboxypeptidase